MQTNSGEPFDSREDESPSGGPAIDYEDDAPETENLNGNGDGADDEDEAEEDEEFEDDESGDEDEEPAFDAEEDEEEADAAVSVRDGIGRAAAVLKYIVERIVDEPEKISIGAAEDDRGPVLLLKVAEDDRGKVIGRQGRIVQAIRTVVKAATVGTGEKVSVEIID